MALHVREQIMVAMAAALTSLTTIGANVFRDRDTGERPLQASEVPALVLEDNGEPAETVTLGAGGIMERTMAVRVTAHVKAASGTSAQLNLILKEVEIALAGASLGGAKYALLRQVGQREVSEATDLPTLRQAFDFDVLYYTARGTPDVAL